MCGFLHLQAFFGTHRGMEETVVEVRHVNKMLFDIIKSKTKVTEAELNDVIQEKKDWFILAEDVIFWPGNPHSQERAFVPHPAFR